MGFKGAKAYALDFYEKTQLDMGSFEGRFGEAGSQLDRLYKRMVGLEADESKRMSGFKKDVIKTRQSGTAITKEVKEALKVKHDLTSTNLLKKVRRALGSMTSINPELVGDLTEKLLSGNYTDKEIAGAWRTFHETVEQMQNDGYKVGHHAISLSLMREPLSNLPRETQNQVLSILEQDYGYQFAETGMKYVSPLGHESAQMGQTRKPGSVKTGMRLDIQEGLAQDGKPIANIDEVNPNLRELLEPRMAHADRFGGNKGFGKQAIEAISGETDAAKIAAKLQPFIEVELAGTRQGLETTKAIFDSGFKDGKFVPENWKAGGVVEKALSKVETIKPPNVISSQFAKIGKFAKTPSVARTLAIGGIGGGYLLSGLGVKARELEVEENPNDPWLKFQLKIDKAAHELDKVALGGTVAAPATGGTSLAVAGAAETGSLVLGGLSLGMDATRSLKKNFVDRTQMDIMEFEGFGR